MIVDRMDQTKETKGSNYSALLLFHSWTLLLWLLTGNLVNRRRELFFSFLDATFVKSSMREESEWKSGQNYAFSLIVGLSGFLFVFPLPPPSLPPFCNPTTGMNRKQLCA
ncbi:hypothetical protein F5H01DRAFT_349949 [Linnemannia elongata]|nr:hypothetical protein F5H01DRAFT_349949 [Linnemannia elongata]